MKPIIVLAAIGLVSFGLADSASASKAGFEFSPVSTKFSDAGPTSATLNGLTLDCTGALTGATMKAGIGKVTGGSFTGVSGCSSVTLTSTPWKMVATSATTATITGIAFTTPFGICGPADLTVTLTGGTFSYNGAFDQCSNISLTLETTPTVTIVAK